MNEEKVNEEKVNEEKVSKEKNIGEKIVEKEYLTPYKPGEIKKRLNENKDAIIAEYKAGATLQQLGLKYKVSAQTIKNFLVKHNIPRRKTGKEKNIPVEMIKEVFKKYREKRTCITVYGLAKELRTTEPTIRKKLRKYVKEGKLTEKDLYYLCSRVAVRNLIYKYGPESNNEAQIEKKEENKIEEKKEEPQTIEKKEENTQVENKTEPQGGQNEERRF